MLARGGLVLRAPFALGQVLKSLFATQEGIEMVKKLLLLPLRRFVVTEADHSFFGTFTTYY